jgi:hypothetical protein
MYETSLLVTSKDDYRYKVITKKTNQESYLIFCFIETFVLLWVVRIIILAMYNRFVGCQHTVALKLTFL